MSLWSDRAAIAPTSDYIAPRPERPEPSDMLRGPATRELTPDLKPRDDTTHEQRCAPPYDQATPVLAMRNKAHRGHVFSEGALLLGRPE